MGHSVDKELAGLLHLNSCGQQFDVQVGTSDKCPQGSVLGLVLLNIPVSNMDNGTEGILHPQQGTELCGVVHVLERRDAIQRDL